MSGKGLQSSKIQSRYPKDLKGALNSFIFKGVALGGGKTNKTAVANIEYFVKKNKIFLHSLKNKIKTEDDYSSDQQLYEYLTTQKSKIKYIAINAPLSLPKCIRCTLKCPGFEKCTEPEITWLWASYRKSQKKKNKQKLFTPYTERCAEVFLANELDEKFYLSHALGANMAPMTARAYYLRRRINKTFIEVYPKLSLWRIGRSIGIQKSYLRTHKHSVHGEEVRAAIIKHLIKSDIAFIYEEDKKKLVEDFSSFEAFLCALTGVLKYKKQVQPVPKTFPRQEGWIELPNQEISW